MKTIKKIDNYLVTRQLNKDKDIIMYEAIDEKTNKLVVIKAFPTKLFNEKRKLNLFKRELKLLSGFNHTNIVKLHSLKKTDHYYYLIIEYCNGGKLSEYKEYYQETYKKPLSEAFVQKILKQVLNALNYMHNCNTMHRDIRIETIQLDFPSIKNIIKDDKYPEKVNYVDVTLDSNFIVKIADLSIARELDENGVASTVCGAPLFMAPDIFLNKQSNENYKLNADLWSLGAMTFELLVGYPPFKASNMPTMISNLNKGNYAFPKDCKLSYEAMSFIDGLLQLIPEDRMDWNQISEHPFMMNHTNSFYYLGVQSKPIEMNIKKKDNLKWVKENPMSDNKIVGQKKINEEKENEKASKDLEEIKKKLAAQKEKIEKDNIEKEKLKKVKEKEKVELDRIAMEKENEKALKELEEMKKKLALEKTNVEKEKEKAELDRIAMEKKRKEAEELKKKTEAEQLKLKQEEKNKKEQLEKQIQQEQLQKKKEVLEQQKEIERIKKEKESLLEEEKKYNQLKIEADQMLKNAAKLKEEAEKKNTQIIQQKEIEDKKKIEEEKQRELRENSRQVENSKLLEEFKNKETNHKEEKAKLQNELNAMKELANNLQIEAEEKKMIQKALQEKEKEHEIMQEEIEKIMNESEKKMKQIEQEKKEHQLQIDQEHQRKEEEELKQKEIELNNNILQKETEIQQIQLSIEPQKQIIEGNDLDEWECLSCKSMELGDDIASDFIIINDYESFKANL